MSPCTDVLIVPETFDEKGLVCALNSKTYVISICCGGSPVFLGREISILGTFPK